MFALAVVGCNSRLPAQIVRSTATSLPDILFTLTLTVVPAATATVSPPRPTSTGTQTQYPTITPIPSDTPVPSATPLGAGPTRTPQYACELVDKYPDQWAAFRSRSPFEARWKVKNTGATAWLPGRVALKYISGVKMHVADEKQELTFETAPDSLLLLIVQMMAPKARGDYAATWGLVEKRTGLAFCLFTAKILVK